MAKFKNWITAIDAHTEGEPVRLVTSGLPYVPGQTMLEKMEYFSQNLDHFRAALCDEPRGHEAMYVVVMTPPVSREAAFGVLFMMSPKEYHDMCGHGSIGVATIAVEMGIVEAKEPVTEVVFDAPAGTVHVMVNVEQTKAKSVTIRNVPSFLYASKMVNVPSFGEIPVDVAFGGNAYAIMEAKDIGVKPEPKDLARAEELLQKIKECVNEQIGFQHPEYPEINGIHILEICDKPRSPKANSINIATVGFGKNMDRSPCGTGTSAKMAALWAKGKLKLGETYATESIIGSIFYGKLVKEVKVGDFRAVVPEITGSAWITGVHNFVIDDDDPFKYGFSL